MGVFGLSLVARSDWMTKASDESLLRQIAKGEKSAVSEFVDRYGGLLWSLALRFTKSAADAEDAVQDVFIELWKCADRFDPEIAAEKTFVSMVARRRLIDRTRAKRLQTTPEVDLNQFAEKTEDASSRAELNDEARKAVEILDDLPGEQSQAIRLAIFEGLSHTQIAAATGMSLGTVKTHIRRGLIKIRQRIGLPSPVDVKGGVV